MMTQAQRRLVMLTIVLVLLSVLSFLVFRQSPDLRTSMARALQVPMEERRFFFLNLPIRPDRLPGTVFTKLYLPPIEIPDYSRFGLSFGNALVIDASEALGGAMKDSLLSPVLGFGSDLASWSTVKLRVRELQVVTPVGEHLRRALKESKRIRELTDRGVECLVITQAFMGKVEVELSRTDSSRVGSDVTASKFGNARSKSGWVVKAVGGSGRNGTLLLSSAAPVTFAFQAASVEFVSRFLDETEPDSVALHPLSAY